jgi:hypothetical protein
MTRYLTKSRFKLAVECPTKLYYTGKDSIFRNLKREDTFLQALARGGFQVGKMATMLYPEGKEIAARSNAEAEHQTQLELSAHENIVLFEPAIRFENLFIRVDILVKRGNHFELIEVKAKSYDSHDPEISGVRADIRREMLPYIQDVAFQRYVLKSAFPSCSVSSYLMMPDKTVSAKVDGLNQFFKVKSEGLSTEVVTAPGAQAAVESSRDLLALVPVDVYVDIVMEKGIQVPGEIKPRPLAELAREWSRAYSLDQQLPPVLHKDCAACEFREHPGGDLRSGFHECVGGVMGLSPAEIEQGTVLDIWYYTKKDKLLGQGIYRYSQVTDEDIKVKSDKDGLTRSQRQWMQVSGLPKESVSDGFFLDRELIRREMNRWRYPLHMIDFETATVALPFFKGMRPYESLAFQFSHHVIEQDGSVRHVGEYLLAEQGVYPNFEFVRALKAALSHDDGTIFRWSNHENAVLDHIAEQIRKSDPVLPDANELLAFIGGITKGGTREMVDLAKIAERAYFHPETKARVSIKKVLPAVLKTSEYLRHKYQRPIYGIEIPSRNYEGFSWWEERSGVLIDPYQRLRELTDEMLGEMGADAADAEALEIDINISEGGAAAMAFARLQFEDLDPDVRAAIKAALLRYCELDTLAMVMIVEAWREWSR